MAFRLLKKIFTATFVNPVVKGLKASYASGPLSNNPTTETLVSNCILKKKEKGKMRMFNTLLAVL